MANFKKILKWFVIVCLGLFFIVYVVRIFYFVNLRKTEAAVAKIHATKLTLDDVMGTNLPPDPGEAADDAIEGIDANKNGIRDDVELAIFEEYPDSAKTRAVLLQYALALQMEMTQEIVNTDIVIAAVQEESRAYLCVGDIFPRGDITRKVEESDKLRSFVENLQVNTEARNQARDEFYNKIDSHESLERRCDIDYSVLPN
jgi:hypothetical protein